MQGQATIGTDPLHKYEFWFNDVRLPFYTMADLLGWVISIAGRAPKEATETNFYLPLLSLYASWITKLSPSKRQAPRTVQITYLCSVMHHLNLALGASIGGGGLREQVQPKRYTLLEEVEGVRLAGVDYSIPQKFGHCAEVYPLSLLFLSVTYSI
jgi:hypothetical protein